MNSYAERRRQVTRDRIYATDAQLTYLRRLLHEAFAHRFTSYFDVHHLELVTKSEASAEIDRLLTAKRNGWPGREP